MMSSDDEEESTSSFDVRSSTQVARKCREFYLCRLQRTETQFGHLRTDQNISKPSTLDSAMQHLRREIASLISQDNDLFRQLLYLNDSIAELREQQKRCSYLEDLGLRPVDEDSLESLSESDTTPSPASTISSSSSHFTVVHRPLSSGRTIKETRPRSVCLRCRGNKGVRRRALSYANLYYNRTDDNFDSYDSGIHLHSDSDHEIFV